MDTYPTRTGTSLFRLSALLHPDRTRLPVRTGTRTYLCTMCCGVKLENQVTKLPPSIGCHTALSPFLVLLNIMLAVEVCRRGCQQDKVCVGH